MPPRPTPRQRAVLEAMSDGTLLIRLPHSGADWVGNVRVRIATSDALIRHGWIKRAVSRHYVITEAGRRAVARSDGGV